MSSPVHIRAFVSSKRRRPAPLYLADEDDELSSAVSSARSSPTSHTPRRHKGSRPVASPAGRKSTSASPLPSSRSRYQVHNLRSTSAAAQLDKSVEKWSEQSVMLEKDELADKSRYSGLGGEEGGRRLGLRVSVVDEDGKMSRAHSSPPSLLSRSIAHAYRNTLRDSDEDSPCNTLKRQRTACASPNHVTTPPSSPIVTVSSHSFHYSYPIQPSPSPMLRQLTLESNSPPAKDDGLCVSTVHVSSSTMYFSRPLSLIIEEADDIIVPVPYTPTPHPSPASPAISPRRNREGRLLSLPYAGVSMRRGVRKTQQDSFVCRGEQQPVLQQAATADCAVPESFFAVLDGHGIEGGEVSTETSSWLPTYFFSSLAAATEPSSPSSASSSVSSVEPSSSGAVGAAFDTSFAMTDHLICEEKGYRGGTTACCAYFTYQHNTAPANVSSHTDSPTSVSSSPFSAHSSSSTGLTLQLASVGDSRAILFSSSRPPRILTTDHSTSSDSEQARITAAGGHLLFSHCSLRVNGVLNVTRSIGDRALKQFVISQPQQAEMQIVDTDEVLMLLTDGVSNAVSMDDLQAAVSQLQDKPGELADHIVDLALSHGSKDNVTAVCLHLPTYLTHLRNAVSVATKPPPSLLTSDIADHTSHVHTPPPSRERREAAHLPPVPPFTCSPTPSSPSPSVTESTLVCSVRSAERSSGGVWRKAPLTSRSRLSTSFFAMLPDSQGSGEIETGSGGDVSALLSETGVVLC